jgi:hypothetical protein
MHPLRKVREMHAPSMEAISAILAPGVIMYSPILAKHLEGREVVALAIYNSSRNRSDGNGEYLLEHKIDERTTFLFWRGTIEGHIVESLELLTDDENGLLLERHVAYRPFPAVKIFRDRMYNALKDKLSPEWWDYSPVESTVD